MKNFMAASLPSFGGIASRLVHDGLISEEAMQKVLAETQQQKTNLIAHLVDNKLVRPDAIAWVVSREFGDPLIDLEAINVNYIPKDAVEEKIIRQFNIVPIFQRGSRLFVAMSDPTQVDALDALRFGTRLTVETVVAEHHKIKAVIEKVSQALVEATGAPIANVRVLITEVPKENWGIAGVSAKELGR